MKDYNVFDYISIIIIHLLKFSIAFIGGVLFVIAAIKGLINGGTIIPMLIVLAIGIYCIYKSYPAMIVIILAIKDIKKTKKLNIYIRSIGELIDLVAGILFVLYMCILMTNLVNIEEHINFFRNYFLFIIISFAIGVIIIFIDIIVRIDYDDDNKTLLLTIDKSNK